MPASPSPRPSPRRRLLRLDFSAGQPTELAEAIADLLDGTTLTHEERVQVQGYAFVMEALRPHWCEGRSALEAHERLRAVDPELADAVEALAPMLLGRAQARADGEAALRAVEDLLGGAG